MTELRPDPIRSDTSRHESRAAPEGETDAQRRPAKAERRISCDLASQAGLANKRKNVGLRDLDTACFREAGDPNRPNGSRLRSSRASARTGVPNCSRSPTPPGPRAASPRSPRRDPRSAAPEVPSIGELPSRQTQAFTGLDLQVGNSPQVVANLWETLGAAFRLIRIPMVLTYRGRRSPCLRCGCNWAETQNNTNGAARLTPVAAPATQLGRARELTGSWGGLGADTPRSHRLLRSERSTV
jgi:hypothetical protein